MFLDIMAVFFFFSGTSTIMTHSLVMVIVWTIIVSVAVIFLTKRDYKKSLFIGLLVFSHWILDLIGWPMSLSGLIPDQTGVPIAFDRTQTIGLGIF